MPMEDSVVDVPAPNENHGHPETTAELQNVQVEVHNDIENQAQQSPPGRTPLLGNSNSDQQHGQENLETQAQPIITSLQSSNLQRLFEIVPFARKYYYHFTARQQQVSSQEEEEEELSRVVEVVTSISSLLIQSLTGMTVGTIIIGQLSPKILRIPGYNQIMFTVMLIQCVAVPFMMLGMYQQVRRKRLSKWVQCIGHLLAYDGFLIMGAAWLGLPQRLLPIPLLLVDLLLFVAFISM